MKVFWLPLALCFLSLTPWASYAQNQNDLIGTWRAQPKVSITFSSISPTGQLKGIYSDNSGPVEIIYPVLGWANLVKPNPRGEKIVPVIFTMSRDAGGSIMVWTGYLSKSRDGELSIATIWNWISASPDPDHYVDQTKVNTAVFKQ